MPDAKIEHRWEYCDFCDHDVVVCGKCGNNTCNGGHGTVDGKECDQCENAYELYSKGMNMTDDKIEPVEDPDFLWHGIITDDASLSYQCFGELEIEPDEFNTRWAYPPTKYVRHDLFQAAIARADRLEAALQEIGSITVHSGGSIHGINVLQWEAALRQAQEVAHAALKGEQQC